MTKRLEMKLNLWTQAGCPGHKLSKGWVRHKISDKLYNNFKIGIEHPWRYWYGGKCIFPNILGLNCTWVFVFAYFRRFQVGFSQTCCLPYFLIELFNQSRNGTVFKDSKKTLKVKMHSKTLQSNPTDWDAINCGQMEWATSRLSKRTSSTCLFTWRGFSEQFYKSE